MITTSTNYVYELKRYEVIYNKAHEVIKDYKQNSQSVNDFREIDVGSV